MANTTKTDIRNVVAKVPFSRIAPGAGPDPDRIELDNILNSIDSQVTPLLEMRESSTPDLVLNIGPIAVQDPEYNFWKTIPPISGVLPNITSMTVVFPAASGGNAIPSAGSPLQINITSGNFRKCGLSLNKDGELVLQVGAEGASEAAATAPSTVANTFPIGYVVLENQGGTIQNITNASIYQYIGGGGGSGGLSIALISAAGTAEVGKHYLVDSTSAAFTVDLPPGEDGAVIRFSDVSRTWDTNIVTLDGDGAETIQGDATLELDVEGTWVQIMWDGTEWKIDTAFVPTLTDLTGNLELDGDMTIDGDLTVRNTGGSNILFVDHENSRVGIGPTAPAAGTNLDISTSNTLDDRILRLGNGDADIKLGIRGSDSDKFVMEYNGTKIADYGSDTLALRPTTIFRVVTAGTERFRVDNLGNVGIGTASPGGLFEAAAGNYLFGPSWPTASLSRSDGRMFLTANEADAFMCVHSTNATVQANDGSHIRLGASAVNSDSTRWTFAEITGLKENGTSGNYSSALKFSTNNSSGTLSERMRIDSSGNVGIGTASPGTKLEVRTAVGSDGILVKTGASGNGRVEIGNKGTGNGNGYILAQNSGGSLIWELDANSTAGGGSHVIQINGTAGLSTGTAWTNTSDERLKDIQGDYEKGLAEITQLKIKNWNYKEGNPLDLPSEIDRVGVIAQDVQGVLPDAIFERPDGYLEMNPDPIFWTMVKAIQELSAKVDSLEEQINNG